MPRKSVTISTGARLSWLFPFLLIFQATEPRSGSPRTSYCRWTQHGDCWPGHRHMGQIISRYNQERSGSKSPVALEMRTWFNPNQITRWFFLPGIIGLLSFSQVFLLSGLPSPGTGRRNVRADLGGAHFRAIILIGKAFHP